MPSTFQMKFANTTIHFVRIKHKGIRFFEKAFSDEATASLLQSFLKIRWQECPIDRYMDEQEFFKESSGEALDVSGQTPEEFFLNELDRFKFSTEKMKDNVYSLLYQIYPDLVNCKSS